MLRYVAALSLTRATRFFRAWLLICAILPRLRDARRRLCWCCRSMFVTCCLRYLRCCWLYLLLMLPDAAIATDCHTNIFLIFHFSCLISYQFFWCFCCYLLLLTSPPRLLITPILLYFPPYAYASCFDMRCLMPLSAMLLSDIVFDIRYYSLATILMPFADTPDFDTLSAWCAAFMSIFRFRRSFHTLCLSPMRYYITLHVFCLLVTRFCCWYYVVFADATLAAMRLFFSTPYYLLYFRCWYRYWASIITLLSSADALFHLFFFHCYFILLLRFHHCLRLPAPFRCYVSLCFALFSLFIDTSWYYLWYSLPRHFAISFAYFFPLFPWLDAWYSTYAADIFFAFVALLYFMPLLLLIHDMLFSFTFHFALYFIDAMFCFFFFIATLLLRHAWCYYATYFERLIIIPKICHMFIVIRAVYMFLFDIVIWYFVVFSRLSHITFRSIFLFRRLHMLPCCFSSLRSLPFFTFRLFITLLFRYAIISYAFFRADWCHYDFACRAFHAADAMFDFFALFHYAAAFRPSLDSCLPACRYYISPALFIILFIRCLRHACLRCAMSFIMLFAWCPPCCYSGTMRDIVSCLIYCHAILFSCSLIRPHVCLLMFWCARHICSAMPCYLLRAAICAISCWCYDADLFACLPFHAYYLRRHIVPHVLMFFCCDIPVWLSPPYYFSLFDTLRCRPFDVCHAAMLPLCYAFFIAALCLPMPLRHWCFFFRFFFFFFLLILFDAYYAIEYLYFSYCYCSSARRYAAWLLFFARYVDISPADADGACLHDAIVFAAQFFDAW